MKKVLLYSGGMDSWIIDKLWNPDIKLYVNMHTKYSDIEISKLPKDVTIIDFALGQWELDNSIIPLRNLYLLMVACNITDDEDVEICFGGTDGDRCLDQGYEFQKKAEDILSYLYQPQSWTEGKKIKINTDFIHYSKPQLVKKYINCGGKLEDILNYSYSCYDNKDGTPCWNCKPCFRKFIALYNNGYIFSDDVIQKNIEYFNNVIYPDMLKVEEGKVYRCKDEDDAIKSFAIEYNLLGDNNVWSK